MNKAGFVMSIIGFIVSMTLLVVGIALTTFMAVPMTYAAGMSGITWMYVLAFVLMGLSLLFAIIFYVAGTVRNRD